MLNNQSNYLGTLYVCDAVKSTEEKAVSAVECHDHCCYLRYHSCRRAPQLNAACARQQNREFIIHDHLSPVTVHAGLDELP